MTIPSDLIERWSHLQPGPDEPSFQRVDELHPLDLYLGIDASSDRMLMLLTSSEPHPSIQFRGLEIVLNRRHDRRWALIVRLKDASLLTPFAYLCSDLIDSSRDLKDGPAAARHIIARLRRWQQMFDQTGKGILDDSSIRGLVGELLFLERFVLVHFPKKFALEGWIGPLDADQDFRLGPTAFEIKAVRSGAQTVAISSLEQLDISEGTLFLVLITLDTVTADTSESVSLAGLVKRIRTGLAEDSDASDLFETRLTAVGYQDLPIYAEMNFVCAEVKQFAVVDGFPRMIRKSAPAGVARASYDIWIKDCLPFANQKL
jgi:hypothetical protein